MSKVLISIEGGLGKNVMFTSLLPEIHKKWDEIYVISPYYDVFQCCPDVAAAFPMGHPSLYQLVLQDDIDVMWREPYSNNKFIKKQVHLFDAWREEFGLDPAPEDHFAKPSPLKNTIDVYQGFPDLRGLIKKFREDNPKYMFVQFTGGQSPLQMMEGYNPHNEALKRNYFRYQELVDLLREKYPDTKIFNFNLKNELQIEGTHQVEIPYLCYVELAKTAERIVCTDSSLQHLCTQSGVDGTIIWGETKPEHFGYSFYKNINSKDVLNSQPYFKPMGSIPAICKFPTPEEIMTVVES